MVQESNEREHASVRAGQQTLSAQQIASTPAEASPAEDQTDSTVDLTATDLLATAVVVSKPRTARFGSGAEVTEITDGVISDVQTMIDDWAAAWSNKNVIAYLAHYSADFAVPSRQSRTGWEALRRSRLVEPQSIEISIIYDNFRLKQPNVVEVKLDQKYRSNLYKDSTRKQFVVRKEGTTWRILSEKSL
jgi:ketosteroid isomerase-like protein